MCINILMYLLYIGHDDPEVNVQHTAQISTQKSSVEGFTYEYSNVGYGVATISRLLRIIGLFCKRALYKLRYSAQETYCFKEPTSQPPHICACQNPQRRLDA